MRGKGSKLRLRGSFRGDHPRLCGEKAIRATSATPQRGSPPPMRGKGSALMQSKATAGITPAYAGKSANVTLAGSSGWDHPRLCGEKTICGTKPRFPLGSPPPMRGKACKTGQGHAKRGITPAYAGKRFADYFGVTTD